jgi:hypothetical protein
VLVTFQTYTDVKCVIILIAEKQAYLLTVEALDLQEGKSYADENGLFFMETSAKTAQNVNELFYEIGMLQEHISMSIIPYCVQEIRVKLLLRELEAGLNWTRCLNITVV